MEIPWQDSPRVDFDAQPEYRWPSQELGLDEDDLFGALHSRFNTAPIFIQNPLAFHKYMVGLVRQASDKQDFYTRMQRR